MTWKAKVEFEVEIDHDQWYFTDLFLYLRSCVPTDEIRIVGNLKAEGLST